MNFWDLNYQDSVSIVECDSNTEITYDTLRKKVNDFSQLFEDFPQKTMGFLVCNYDLTTIVTYLAALQQRQALFLLPEKLDQKLFENLVIRYQPDWLFMPKEMSIPNGYNIKEQVGNYFFILRIPNVSRVIYPDLAILLSTSGTTGSPKAVRLSYNNLQSNALAISQYLAIEPQHKAITTLPMQYSYGLSVINSHLVVGASIIITRRSILEKEFWEYFNGYGATFLAGVPYTYQMLSRLRFDRMDLPSLKILTQAGGRLDEKLQKQFVEVAQLKQYRFYIMYGQTEATARISYVPFDRLPEKIGSIGIPIPNGTLELDSNNQLIYKGPNVMLGYAEGSDDLEKGDELCGKLETGDIAYQDKDGFYYITGRLKRFIKLFGLRVNLDEIEKKLEDSFNQRVYCVGTDDLLSIYTTNQLLTTSIGQFIVQTYKLHPSAIKVFHIDDVPLLSSGKVDYGALQDRSN